MATVGYTANGTGADTGFRGFAGAIPVTAPEDGWLHTLMMWLTAVTADQTLTLAVWADAAGLPDTGALLGQTASITAPVAGGTQQISGPLTTRYLMARGAALWIGFVSNAAAGNTNLLDYTSQAITGRFKATTTVDNPFGTSTAATAGAAYPLGGIYTPTKPALPVDTPLIYLRRNL